VRSPLDRGFAVFPERRPFAALDGRTDTSWIASTFSAGSRRWLEVDLDRPRVLPAIGVLPHRDPLGRTTRIALSLDGGPERTVDLAPGWTTVPVGGGPVRRLRLRVAASDAGPFAGPGGIAELRLPGVRASERLRLPLTLARRARGLDLSRAGLAVLFERTTADFPGRAGAEVGAAQGINPFDMVDAEAGLERELELPEGRRFAVDGWAGVDPRAPDEALDRLAGLGRGWRLRSSSRFEGAPGHRASSAFDGDRGTAWVGDWMEGREAWLEWRAPGPVRLRTLRLEPGGPQYASPARVVVETPRRTWGPLDVGIDGRVTLPRAVRTDRARIRVLALRGVPEDTQLLRAVAVGEVVAAGLRPPAPRRDGRFSSACGALRVAAAGAERPLAVTGAVGDLDAGLPLRVRECGPGRGLALPGGRTRLSAPPGRVFRPDHLRLDAPAPAPRARSPGWRHGHAGHRRARPARRRAGRAHRPVVARPRREPLARLARVVPRRRRPRAGARPRPSPSTRTATAGRWTRAAAPPGSRSRPRRP
jgi:hypothetical protein